MEGEGRGERKVRNGGTKLIWGCREGYERIRPESRHRLAALGNREVDPRQFDGEMVPNITL